MARPKKIKVSLKDILLEVREENKKKLDEILSIPNYQEVLGRKYYGDDWRKTLWGEHPERTDALKRNQERVMMKKRGEKVEPYQRANAKSVIQLDFNGNEVRRWETAVEAALDIKGNRAAAQQIVMACKGDANSAYGYKWEFDC